LRVLVASFVLTLTMATSAAATSSVLTGAWDSIDVDGSYQQLFIGGGKSGLSVHYVDHGATLCHNLGAPNGVATIRGTGTVAGSTLSVSFDEIRCSGGIVFETPGGGWIFEHDPASGTLVVNFGSESEPHWITWHRIGSR
jgi:hypothetical protein